MRKALSLTKANDLYLITLLLVVTLGSVAQYINFSLGLILTEVVCIFLPAWWMLRWQKVEIKSSTRLRWPGWGAAIFSLVLGAAAWMVGAVLDGLMGQVLGYTPGLPSGALPQTTGQAALLFLAMAVLPPLCEEFLFRGVLMRSWQRKGTRAAVWAGVLLFMFYHLRLQGLVGLLPISVLLVILVLRTDSLVSGVLAHFANNFLAVLVTVIAVQMPQVKLPFPSLLAAGVGLIVLVIGLWMLHRATPAPAAFDPGKEPPEPTAKGIIRTAPRARMVMPLLLTAGIYLFFAASEVIDGRFPDLLAQTNLALNQPALTQPLELNYEVRNPLDEPIGSAHCTLTPQTGDLKLECTKQAAAYRVQRGNSLWQSEAYTQEWSAVWQTPSMGLAAYSVDYTGQGYTRQYQLDAPPSGLTLKIQSGTESSSIGLAPSTIVEEEWPWRLMGMTFRMGLAQKAMFITPLRYQPDLNISGPSQHNLTIYISGTDLVQTPAGTFSAWKVRVGDEGYAWYEVAEPHRLVKLQGNYEWLVLK